MYRKYEISKMLALLAGLLFVVGLQAQTWTLVPNLNQNVLSLTTGANHLIVGLSDRIEYTSNQGANWDTASGISTSSNSFYIDGSDIYSCSYQKLYRSADDGASWTGLSTVDANWDVTDFLISNGVWVCGTNFNGIHYSQDQGATWVASSSAVKGRNSALVELNDRLYASTYANGSFQQSRNDGLQWVSPTGNGITMPGGSWPDISDMEVGCADLLIAAVDEPFNGGIYQGVYFSTDSGYNWTHRISGLTDSTVSCLHVSGDLIFAGTDDAGVFYTTDQGQSWSALNTGLGDLRINAIHTDGSTVYAATQTGLYSAEICNLIKSSLQAENLGSSTPCPNDQVIFRGSCDYNYAWLYLDSAIVGSSNELQVNASGFYQLITTIDQGCVDTSSSIFIEFKQLDASASRTGNTLSATTAGASYQWLNCETNHGIVTGATAQSYSGPPGFYAVQLSKNGCVDTSACLSLYALSLGDQSDHIIASIYPNPSAGSTWIELNPYTNNTSIQVHNTLNQLILEMQPKKEGPFELELPKAVGMYFVTIWQEGRAVAKRRILRQ